MRIIFLNTWQGNRKKELSDFVRSQEPDTDIFCFQEVYKDARDAAEKHLDEFSRSEAFKKVPRTKQSPVVTYFRSKSSALVEEKPLFTFKSGFGIGLYTHIRYYGCDLHIMNLHGTSQPGDKLDTDVRRGQSREILELLSQKKGFKIAGGDFNLLPETESVRMFEAAGYRNLIAEYAVDTTRNRFAWEKHSGAPQLFADYVFAGPEVPVEHFEVPKMEVSDHLPLILTLNV